MTKEELQKYFDKNFPISKHMGLEIQQSGQGCGSIKVPLIARNTNHFGVLHAGVQWTAAEAIGGLLFFSSFGTDDYFLVVKELHIAFRKPAIGDLVADGQFDLGEMERIDRELKGPGKTEFSLNIQLKDMSSDVMTVAEGLYYARRNP